MKLISVTLTDSKEDLIGDALRSVVDWVDYCLVIDTGAEDETERAASAVAGEKLVYTRSAWHHDFAKARNQALDTAASFMVLDGSTEDDSWAVMLDTDERIITNGEDIRATLDKYDIKSVIDGKRVDVLMMTAEGGSYTKERIFRLSCKERYSGPIHEAYPWHFCNPETFEKARFKELPKTPEQLKAKSERDARILALQTFQIPEDPRWHFYLGESLMALELWPSAIDSYERCANLRGWPEESAWACYRAADCCLRQGLQDAAVTWCTKGLDRHSGVAELAWLAGFACYQKFQLLQAINWSQMAIANGYYKGYGRRIERLGFKYMPGLYEGPYDTLRWAYKKLEMADDAAQAEEDYLAAKLKRMEEVGE